jgi:hypothetical protein
MIATDVQINFNASASLRKWPSIDNQRRTDSAYPGLYLLFDGIHTTPQPPLVSAVLSVEPGAELAQLRAFLSP